MRVGSHSREQCLCLGDARLRAEGGERAARCLQELHRLARRGGGHDAAAGAKQCMGQLDRTSEVLPGIRRLAVEDGPPQAGH